MKLKINRLNENNKQEYKFTDADLPLVIRTNKYFYMIIKDATLDDERYCFVSLTNGHIQSGNYKTLIEILQNRYTEEIVEAELIIK